jgi:flavin-dependent dehydrogenase
MNLNQLHLPYSIGIVGAGPAGSMAAALLASQGHKVRILERKKTTDRKVCGEYLCPKGVELLEKLGLYGLLCSDFKSLSGMLLVSPDNDQIPAYFPQLSNSERGVSVNRQIFDQKLLELAIKNGAELSINETVTSISKNASEKWDVITANEKFEFDFLIAADGRQSKIGHQLGHIKEINTERAALHCYLPRKIDRGLRLGEMHILENGNYCGLDPINDDEVNFSIVCNSRRLKYESAKEIINNSIKSSKRLSALFDLLSDENKIQIVTTLKNKNHFIAGDGLAYVGDAAGFIDPLTGEGIYNALLSSQLLADSISRNPTLPAALKEYKLKKKKLSFQKNMLNHFFQVVIRSPLLINLTVKFLKKSQKRADNFIGIIGNIYNPITGIIKMLRA